MKRGWLWCFVGLSLAWPAVAAAQSPTRGLRAERFDVALTLLADGSVDVRETVVFRFSEETFSRVEREIPIHRFDGVIDVRASLDGRVLAEGEQPERVRIRHGRNTLRVTWAFPETIDQTRTFTLEYRAMGALTVANGRAIMDWTVLPSRHRYLIDEARVEWRVPESVVRVEPTAMDDVRWTTSAMSDGWAATRHGVGLDETAKLTDAFDLTTMAVSVPAWQTNTYRARQMAPAFVVTAITLLVVGAGVIGMTWFRYHEPAQERGRVEPAHADSLPPAIGTALVRGSVGLGLPQMQATLLDLARRGVLQISEATDDAKRFDIVMPSTPRKPARPHEQAVIDALWLQMKNGRVELSAGWRHLTRAFSTFRRALLADMQEAGFIDAERRSAARAMRIAGFAVLALGIAGLVAFGVAFRHFGDLPLIVPGAVAISGIWFLIASQAMSRLSLAGMAASAEWRARRNWIKAATKARQGTMSGAEITQWLPVAAGFSLAQPMLKANQSSLAQGAAAFEWLGQLKNADAALAAIVATTTAASHHSGGGGGASAGGGSSSAS